MVARLASDSFLQFSPQINPIAHRFKDVPLTKRHHHAERDGTITRSVMSTISARSLCEQAVQENYLTFFAGPTSRAGMPDSSVRPPCRPYKGLREVE
jgi:hypothetical protein